MSLGKPLTDSDRIPWLQALNRALYSSNSGVVLACSALKASYRKLLSEGLTPAPQFILSIVKETFWKSGGSASPFHAS